MDGEDRGGARGRINYGLNNPLKYTDPSGFLQMIPFSDQWLAQQGYGDSARFFSYMRDAYGDIQARTLDEIQNGKMTFSIGGKNFVIIGGSHQQKMQVFKEMRRITSTQTGGETLVAVSLDPRTLRIRISNRDNSFWNEKAHEIELGLDSIGSEYEMGVRPDHLSEIGR